MALKGIKVLEFAGLAPGPFCGMVLADFGASVIRIDKAKAGFDLDYLSNGKQSIAVDLKQPAGVNLIKRLSGQSDVLIDPFRPGVMEGLGLGPNDLCVENPRLIYARLTGFGHKGVYSKRAGHDINYVAMSGLLSLFGRHGEKPMFPINTIADFGGGGLMCALGILLALFERSKSNKGQVVDNSMVEGSAYLGSFLFRSHRDPMIWGNERGCNLLDGGAHFYEVFETKDGKFMSVGAIEPQFYDVLLDGLNLTREDADVFDFDKGKEVFREKFLEKTQEEWCRVFDGKDACVFPVLSMEEAYQHVHNKANNSFIIDEDKNIIPTPSPKLSRTPGVSQASQSRATSGGDTVEIMKKLGYSHDSITELHRAGVINIANSKL